MFPPMMVYKNGIIISEAWRHASRNPAILLEAQLHKWTSCISSKLGDVVSISELFRLFAKCFSSGLKFSYNTFASAWLIVSEIHNRCIVPSEVCGTHLENGGFIPKFVSKSLEPLTLTEQPLPQIEVGTTWGWISRMILFLSIPLTYWSWNKVVVEE